MTEMTPADYGAQAARQDVAQTRAFDNLLKAAEATFSLWIQHGLGDDESESEPVYMMMERAILEARKVKKGQT